MSWHPEAKQYLSENNYSSLQQFYEQLIDTEPENPSHYWYLGLSYLLNEQEEDAQTTWLLVMSQGEEEDIQQWTSQLVEILETEAQRQQHLGNYPLSWLIRAHLREIDPNLINNLLTLILLEIQLNTFKPSSLEDWGVIEGLKESSPDSVDSNLLLEVLAKVLPFPYHQVVSFVESSLPHIADPETFIKRVWTIASQMSNRHNQPLYAAEILKYGLHFQPNNLQLLQNLFSFYSQGRDNLKSLEMAHRFYELSETTALKLYGNYMIITSLIKGGNWTDLEPIKHRNQLLEQFSQENPTTLDPFLSSCFLDVNFLIPYLEDNPAQNTRIKNQIAQLFQTNWQTLSQKPSSSIPRLIQSSIKPLKIGYIAHTLRRHSIGWLTRWLFHYYNRKAFEIIIYLVNQPEDELTHKWFRANANQVYNLSDSPKTIAKKIEGDGINILVDLDSITNSTTYKVMALKPAPIQVTWLGFDGSGLPAIDYYIADRYVLPENAQDYYQEKIWRLPHCYMAVDGFETGVPTLRREDLNIANDAIIYLSTQTGFKRHPDTIRLQMKILKEVPNSYFLIQGLTDEEKIQQLFTEIAQQEGVNPNRLRFLPYYPTETYRANLTIADVVLDTYPFNGGTTTLDILWQGIPVVTRVGQQWASRNGYTLLINAGITEGIAWNDEDYIKWGIQLGTDEKLRQQINWKLRNSRKTAPLWNAKQFTQDMEEAYQQMWANFNF
ncbi:conserved hypothetical protein [Gloeothece citriformis PCC 7424]|uniref:O-GlcNAc transferase C-terminal domain-containing protein n=1 Tax=Gloeothece citriformis (strain PCC 7424) TaxID=65393 RepID=B7KAQ2_GLOC7|nr:hypothetical protein [Gloeothece citriformis]ACK68724.1 conserved hypothetical protein [Gloeothece citriformis PCC 7424]